MEPKSITKKNLGEVCDIYDHMTEFFKFEASNIKEDGKVENEFSCAKCLPEVTMLKTTKSNPTPQNLILHLKKV